MASSSLWATADVYLGDFEDGTTQGWYAWSATAPISAVANPSATGNASSKVLKFDQSSEAYHGFGLWTEPQKDLSLYKKVSLDVYVVGATGSIQLQMDQSSTSSTATFLKELSVSTKDAWVHLDFDISKLTVSDFKQFSFLSGTKAVFYIDNIVLHAKLGDPPTALSLTPGNLSIIAGKSVQMLVTPTPATASANATFTSSATSVASVSPAGVVTALSAGQTIITGTSAAATSVTCESSILVTDPDKTKSMVYTNFEQTNPLAGGWPAKNSGKVPECYGTSIVENPSKNTVNPTDSALEVKSIEQWAAIFFGKIEVNAINKVTWLVYSDVDYSDFAFQVGIHNITENTAIVTANLKAKTWTKMEWTIPYHLLTTLTGDNYFYLQMTSPGSTVSGGYAFLVDQIEFVAGSSFSPVSSFTMESQTGAYEVSLATGTLQMVAKDFLPADATNPKVVWSLRNVIEGDNAVYATIDWQTGLLKVVAEGGSVNVYAQADNCGNIRGRSVYIGKSSDVSLSEISSSVGTISDMQIGRDGEIYFAVILPSGTTTPPTLGAVANSAQAKVEVIQAQTLLDNATIKVTAENGNQWPYPVNFYVSAATNANLSFLDVEGYEIGYDSPDPEHPGYKIGFDKTVTDYSITVPSLTQDVTVMYEAEDENATTTETKATDLSKDVISVTSADGSVTQDYTITITKAPLVSTLSSLSVSDGTMSPAFAAGTTSYVVTFPAGTTSLPTVDYTVTSPFATAEVTNASNLAETTTVVVTAEDGKKTTYTVTYHVISTDASLSSITTGAGTLSPAFSPSTYTYAVVLPTETTTVPSITAVTTSINATKTISNASAIPGRSIITVTAEDGTTTKEYAITFSLEKVLVSRITVEAEATSIVAKGGKLQLSAKVLPSTAKVQTVAWKVSDEAIATISATGLLTAVADGTVTVTATATDGSATTGTLNITIGGQTLASGITGTTDLVMYPNPVIDVLHVSMDGSVKGIEIINLSGKVVASATNASSISMKSLSKGIYLVRAVNADNKTYSQTVNKD